MVPNGETTAQLTREAETMGSTDADVKSTSKPKPPNVKAVRLATLVGSGLGVVAVALTGSLIGTLMPTLVNEFEQMRQAAWYGSAYLLVMGATQPAFGKLTALLASKLVFHISVVFFAAGSVICALAKDSPMFIGGRAVSGLGGGGIVSGALELTTLVDPQNRALSCRILLVLESFGAMVGPAIGGAITSNIGWRWCFWTNLPIAVIVLGLTLFPLRLPRQTSTRRKDKSRVLTLRDKFYQCDVFGGALLAGSLACLLLALEWGGDRFKWDDIRTIILLVAFGISFIFFVIHQACKVEAAVLPIRLCKAPHFSANLFMGFCLGGAQYAALYYNQLPTWFQTVKALSPADSGIRMLAMTAAATLASLLAVGGLKTFRYYLLPLAITAIALASVGAGVLYALGFGMSDSRWIGYLVMYGLGSGMGVQLAILGAQAAVGPSDFSHAISSILSFSAIAGSIFVFSGQQLFINQLLRFSEEPVELKRKTLKISFAAILEKASAEVNVLVANTINDGVRQMFLVGLILCSITIFALPFMPWKPLKPKPQKNQGIGKEATAVTV
ncbi:hypothetical protein jhhlp_006975 [Lomentospora prolificans]|uniref:Major facilitator superfamily (MFS) profile domain-containing protein n=1 Tax=Lomentospora prolificans TaxID=41688 RepID=A0A2N3N1C6_9PEZI|nr:hypothetical protein jhhlp_006975 [Lomentospora prolificans]